MRRPGPALIVMAAGVCAAVHVGKLPPAVPILRDAFGLGLVQAGFLLSMVQFAGMALGLVVGLLADSAGLRRTMVAGLVMLSLASLAGPAAGSAAQMLVLRACEGFGFLLASVAAPGLIRRLVDPAQVNRMMGWWGAYMPFGTAAALLVGPGVMALAGWQAWWLLLGVLSLTMAAWVWIAVPRQVDRRAPAPGFRIAGSLLLTLGSAGPWLVALTFATYSAQWLGVIGFLPAIYAQAGVVGGLSAVATALAAGVNMIGNVMAGRLLHRGVAAPRLIRIGLGAMVVGAILAFAAWPPDLPASVTGGLRFAGVLLFSSVGGMVPGTLFAVAVRVAPGEREVSSTIGWMQQWSSIGQFCGPPVVGWVAGLAGGWSWTWAVTGACAVAGMFLASALARRLEAAQSQSPPYRPANS